MKKGEISIIQEYKIKKSQIDAKLKEFRSLSEEEYFQEFIFCILTPQSNAKKCWEAVEQLILLQNWSKYSLSQVLKTKTRFHNNKALYLLEAKNTWKDIKKSLNKKNAREIRNFLAGNVRGYGLKEASHF